ncbi:MAG: restriction endonuclease subunit S [Pseudomonadota bacterium]
MTTPKLLSAYKLPVEWKCIRLRWLSKRYAGGTPDTKNPEYWEGGTIPWLNSGTVNQGVITEPSEYITELALKESSAKWIPRGALVMALAGQGKTKATVGFLDIRTTGNQSLAAIVPEKLNGKYLYWWLGSQYLTLRNLSSQDGRDGLNLEMIGSIMCPVPTLNTQQRIAQFLDEKTAHIDGLIEKKRALLDRLVEKRQAHITRSVTTGLNPDAPLKPSGIDWLGDIPAHWEVLPVKRIAVLESGHTPDRKVDAYWEDCEIPWVSLNDTAALRAGDYIADTTFKINDLGLANSSARLLPERAVVFTRDATIGESAITTRPMAVSQHIIAWLCDEKRIVPEYLLFAIYGMKGELLRLTKGSTVGTIGLADVNSIRVAVPPVDEQERIVSEIFRQKEKLSDVLDAVKASLERLNEYRAALITAAVTGQLEGLQ